MSYICWRRRASCGLRTVAMSLNAISCCVSVSATSDEMPLSVTRHPSNLSACATVLSIPEAPEPQDASARLRSPDHDTVVAQRHPSRCRQRLQATAPGVGLHQYYNRRRARICHASARLAISSTARHMPSEACGDFNSISPPAVSALLSRSSAHCCRPWGRAVTTRSAHLASPARPLVVLSLPGTKVLLPALNYCDYFRDSVAYLLSSRVSLQQWCALIPRIRGIVACVWRRVAAPDVRRFRRRCSAMHWRID